MAEVNPSVSGGLPADLASVARPGSSGNAEKATAAYAAGKQVFAQPLKAAPLPADACGFSALDTALDALDGATGAVKEQVLNACAACIGQDGVMTIDESELLRTVADALDCPMPPPVARTS